MDSDKRDPVPAPPLPLEYFTRRSPRRPSPCPLLLAGTLFVGSAVLGVAGTFVVLRVGRDARYALLSAVIAPIVSAAGLWGAIHSIDLIRYSTKRSNPGGPADGEIPTAGERPADP